MSTETTKFIPKLIEAGHIKFFIKEFPRCNDISCSICVFDCVCEHFADAIDQGTYTHRWNTSYHRFIQPYIKHEKFSIANFKLKYPELFI